MKKLRTNFWVDIPLSDLNSDEWEALCDGCGVCCLIKLSDEDEDSSVNNVHYTNVACQLLDCSTGFCSNYDNRKDYVSDCVQLTYEMLKNIYWLPASCAYRLRYENKPIPEWHPLISGSHETVKRSGFSVSGKCVSEKSVHEDDVENHIIKWVHL